MTEFLRRTYHELVRDTLTRLIGGVAGEHLVFFRHSNEDGFPLTRGPIAELLRLHYRAGDETREIPLDGVNLAADRTRLTFDDNGSLTDGTSIFVDYIPQGVQSPLTDTHVGGVARTLVEALSYELARFYLKLDVVYRSGFVDTADRAALDQLVALLGVTRIRAGRPSVTVTFARTTPATVDIPIPAGTIVSTGITAERGEIQFATTSEQILAIGTTHVDVLARATEESRAVAASVASGELRIMPRPLAGIDSVTNHAAAFASQTDESDEALRLRAKLALQGAGKVTLEALRSTILDQGALTVVLRDMPRGIPGEVEVFIDLPEYEEEDSRRLHQARILRAIDLTRGAGVRVFTNFARKVYVILGNVRAVLREGLNPTSEDRKQLVASIKRTMSDHVTKLTMGEDIARSGLVAAALADTRIRDIVFDDVNTFQADELTATPGGDGSMPRVYDTEIRLRDGAGLAIALLGQGQVFDLIHIAKDEKAVLMVPGDIELVTRVTPTIFAVVVDIEFRITPIDPLVDRDALRDRVVAQRLQPTIKAYFDALGDGDDVVLADVLELLDSHHYSLENAFLDGLHVRDQRVVLGVSTVLVADDERAELGELRVR